MSVHGASVPLPLGKRLSCDDNAASLDYFEFSLSLFLLSENGESNRVALYVRLIAISMRITRTNAITCRCP